MAGDLRHAERERGISTLARRQRGVVSRRQLRQLGIAERTIERWLSIGRLHAVHKEVFAVGYPPFGQHGYWWAGILAYGPEALLSHRSAAMHWGLARQRGSLTEVSAPTGRQGVERRSGIWIHRCKLHKDDRDERSGIPVTSVARTLFDLAEIEPFRRLEQAWEEADRLRFLRLREVELVCERGYGRRALKPIRRLLAAARAPAEGRSPLEERFQPFCQEHRLPEPARNVQVLGREVDALWPDAKLVVELDSWEHHGHRAAFERDRARDPKFLLADYRTIRVTHRRLDLEPVELAAEIRALLGA